MQRPIRLGIAAVASPLEVGAGEAPALQKALLSAFAAHGDYELHPAPGPLVSPNAATQAGRGFYDARVDALCVVAASWFEDYLVLDLLEECGVPVILWARPGMETGSLCGMQQLAFMLKSLGRPHCLLFAEPGEEQALARAHDFALAASVRRQLRRARIGFMGHRVEGMTETTPHELAMKAIFGPRVVGLDTALFLERVAKVPREGLAGRWQEITARVGEVKVGDDTGLEALQVYAALKATVEEAGLDAVAIGCYPHLMGKVCLGVSLLAEEGVPTGCEGDVNGALAMLILARLGGGPVHNTDLLDPIPAHNSLVASHCGAGAFSLASDPSQITLGPVRLMDRGLCCLFTARPGPCTLVNLVPTMGGYRLGVLYGEALETTMVFRGNPLEVRFARGYREVLDWIVERGLGHHWMAAYGDLRQPLRDLAAMAGCEPVSME